jgi:hypothetical protein
MSRREGFTAPVTVEWAVWGKQQGGKKYKVLRCSNGLLRTEDFEEILTKYATAARIESREVTISRFGDGSEAHLGLAIQERTGGVDWTNRTSVEARFYAIPFEHLTQVPVSYEGIYEFFVEDPLPRESSKARLPGLRPGEIAKRVTKHAMRTCALLLTNKPVCIVGADCVPMKERLRFIDTVASLLPYGMRRRFTASTWTSSTADHHFRLYFATAARNDVHPVEWDGEAVLPADAEGAHWYYSKLVEQRGREVELVARLTQATGDMGFKELDFRGLAAAVDGGRLAIAAGPASPTREIPQGQTPHPTPKSIGDLLIELDAALTRGDLMSIGLVLQQLEGADPPAEDKRPRLQETIKNRRLLAQGRAGRFEPRLLRRLLFIAFGLRLGPEHLRRVMELASELHEPLRHALMAESLALTLILSEEHEHETRLKACQELPTPELVALAAQRWLPPGPLETVCEYLCAHRRGRELRTCLRQHAFLATALQTTIDSPQRRYELLLALFGAVYQPGPNPDNLREIVEIWVRHLPMWGTWQAASTKLFGRGAFEVLSELIVSMPIDASGLERHTRDELTETLNAAVGVEPKPGRGRGGHRRWRPAWPNRLPRRGLGKRPPDDADGLAETKGLPSSPPPLFPGADERAQRAAPGAFTQPSWLDRNLPPAAVGLFFGIVLVLITALVLWIR